MEAGNKELFENGVPSKESSKVCLPMGKTVLTFLLRELSRRRYFNERHHCDVKPSSYLTSGEDAGFLRLS